MCTRAQNHGAISESCLLANPPNTYAPLLRFPRLSSRHSMSSKSQMSPEPHQLQSPASLPLGDMFREGHSWAPVNLERQGACSAPQHSGTGRGQQVPLFCHQRGKGREATGPVQL